MIFDLELLSKYEVDDLYLNCFFGQYYGEYIPAGIVASNLFGVSLSGLRTKIKQNQVDLNIQHEADGVSLISIIEIERFILNRRTNNGN